jgi:hypothetical protein
LELAFENERCSDQEQNRKETNRKGGTMRCSERLNPPAEAGGITGGSGR